MKTIDWLRTPAQTPGQSSCPVFKSYNSRWLLWRNGWSGGNMEFIVLARPPFNQMFLKPRPSGRMGTPIRFTHSLPIHEAELYYLRKVHVLYSTMLYLSYQHYRHDATTEDNMLLCSEYTQYKPYPFYSHCRVLCYFLQSTLHTTLPRLKRSYTGI